MTGEAFPAYLFVAVLPCSCFVYAEACADMKTENWLLCHVHAYNYFGGVARLLIPDNLKTGVTSNTRYETVLNRSYQELAVHYGTAIVPARVRKPQDKSHAEGSVRFVETWIIAALRDQKFFTIGEVRQAVSQNLEELNDRPFKQRNGTRRSAYLEEECGFMLPLPANDFEPAVWTTAKVSSDYLVSDGRNKYSVPSNLIGEQVDIRATRNIVEVFYHGSRVASHLRFQTAQHDPIVKPEHMPAHFALSDASVEGIEYYEDRKLDKAQMLRFSTCKFIDEGHHIILKGASGNGKTYIACALGNAACRRFKSVQYIRMPELLDELSIARGCGDLQKVLKVYKKVDLLIVDEWLIRCLNPQESYDLLEIAEARCGQNPGKSMILCTQYETDGWYKRINPDPGSDSPISEAIMDRIIHNAYDVMVGGRISMRERYGLKNAASTMSEAEV